jgi:hypothetical protein
MCPPHAPSCPGFALQDLTPQARADGQLQRYGQELLWQVPFQALQAQVREWVDVDGWVGVWWVPVLCKQRTQGVGMDPITAAQQNT